MEYPKTTWSVYIDTGGTFTDCIAVDPEGNRRKVKVLSSSALRGDLVERMAESTYRIRQDWNATDDLIRGFAFRLLNAPDESYTVTAFHARSSVLTLDRPLEMDTDETVSFEVVTDEEAPVLAARLATQTPAGEPLPDLHLRLATTRGTNALLERKGSPVALFLTKGFGDLLKIGTQQRPDLFALNIEKPDPVYENIVEVAERLDAQGTVLRALETRPAQGEITRLIKDGITTAAVSLMHSHRNGMHEQQLKKWLEETGFTHVSVSSELSRFMGILSRTETTLVNAYLAPVIREYLDAVQEAVPRGEVFVMTSAGGLAPTKDYHPKDSLLSGPAGGVVGAATEARMIGFNHIISFDMGGTSTDVARFDNEYEYVFEHQVGDAHLVAPALSVETVAAGGGSECRFDGHKLCVGPESAGAWPGPACYGAGGPLTITDVNLLLGRLDPQNFHIPVVPEAARQKLREVVDEVEQSTGEKTTEEAILFGFLNIANERMAGAIRKISVRKGYDTAEYALVAFGGAGGQHACAVARRLQMERIVIPGEAGLLSATGLGNAVMEEFAERQVLQPLSEFEKGMSDAIAELSEQALAGLRQTIGDQQETALRRLILSLRFEGQEHSLDVEYKEGMNLHEAYKKTYVRRYGHWISNRTVEVESVRVVASTKSDTSDKAKFHETETHPEPARTKHVWFGDSEKNTPVYLREELMSGAVINGPALILDPYSTIVVEPDWRACIYDNMSIVLEHLHTSSTVSNGDQPEAARLELFTNRFSSIAEEMGEMLQRTALSVNVKDRMDFSCALLNPEGELVVNAPHIPVHLGALGVCVRSLIETIEMEPGDVVMTNHPGYGGSHLPDVTVVTPVYSDGRELIGYTASRAHHAEIGGTHPGSMPPTATRLVEEGVVIPPVHLIRKGKERWSAARKLLTESPWPTRSPEENIADLQAAVAANYRGAEALRAMTGKHGLREVTRYMDALKEHAASKMRQTLRKIPDGTYVSEEYLDDGTPLKAILQVSGDEVSIDFTGTGKVHPRNLNATPAIVNSVVMYVLRLLIDEPLPLNEGLLQPVRLTLPPCLLNPDFDRDPSECPAVVGGNVEVSQRLVDTLLKPFERISCSQGTMNNVLFGNDRFGYYETVGGGTGAGPGFDGADAVHHHMTNTRSTDPEILEHRYPVRLDRYAIRTGSGGRGKYRGGSGIEREMTFLEPVRLTVLTQHRVEAPYGLQGGEPGRRGEQWVEYKDGRKEKLEPTDGRDLQPDDRFILKTPGGGGFGKDE